MSRYEYEYRYGPESLVQLGVGIDVQDIRDMTMHEYMAYRAQLLDVQRRQTVQRVETMEMAARHRQLNELRRQILMKAEMEAVAKRISAFKAATAGPEIELWKAARERFIASGSDDDKEEMLHHVQIGVEGYDVYDDEPAGAQGQVQGLARKLAGGERRGDHRRSLNPFHRHRGPQQAQGRDDAPNPFLRG